MKKKPQKTWTKMKKRESAEATKEYDLPVRPRPVSPSPAELTKHKKAMQPASRRLQSLKGALASNKGAGLSFAEIRKAATAEFLRGYPK